MKKRHLRLRLEPSALVGGLTAQLERAPLQGGKWYVAAQAGGGLVYELPRRALAEARYLTCDLLLDGEELAVFRLSLLEGGSGRRFDLHFGLLNQCSARLRLPLSATDQGAWQLRREGAWLKPMCWGDPVNPARVDRMTFSVLRKGGGPVRWCQTPLRVVRGTPSRLSGPLLPHGPLLDRLGQSRQRDWPGKTRTAREVNERLREQRTAAPCHRWPVGWSKWGGWKERRFEATSFFRTHHDGRRWWLVDPGGSAFWSAGMDCVEMRIASSCDGLESALEWMPPDEGKWAAAFGRRSPGGGSFCYLTANLIRAFGPAGARPAWAAIVLGELRRLGFNTVGNWSHWEIAQASGFPYVRPLRLRFADTPLVFRDFPDVFDARFPADVARFAEQLRATADDPALIGYFLMNEPTWGFASLTPAEGMLRTAPKCPGRRALAQWLKDRYGRPEQLADAWGRRVSFARVAAGPWHGELTGAARADLEAFSTVMVERLFLGLTEACRAVDPNHLNLGARYYTVPPAWALAGMRSFDVFSMNCYRQTPPADEYQALSHGIGMPVMIGEWHFGALDVGLPASGIGHVADQHARGQAFRLYMEAAAATPCCVGAHWFTLYDESALGRGDGENYNIGFLDICHRPYRPLAAAARKSHARLYAVADGREGPYAESPEHLPLLFL
jgi:hypothetical protein